MQAPVRFPYFVVHIVNLRGTSAVLRHSFSVALLLMVLGLGAGCESTDGGSAANTTVYYGAAFSDPWYHGDYDYDYDVVVTPPPGERPPGNRPPPGGGFEPRPEHPIAYPPGERPPRPSTQPTPRPPSVSTMPATRPAPSIPSMPRAAPRGGRR
jgi:hypothetical protein